MAICLHSVSTGSYLAVPRTSFIVKIYYIEIRFCLPSEARQKLWHLVRLFGFWLHSKLTFRSYNFSQKLGGGVLAGCNPRWTVKEWATDMNTKLVPNPTRELLDPISPQRHNTHGQQTTDDRTTWKIQYWIWDYIKIQNCEHNIVNSIVIPTNQQPTTKPQTTKNGFNAGLKKYWKNTGLNLPFDNLPLYQTNSITYCL